MHMTVINEMLDLHPAYVQNLNYFVLFAGDAGKVAAPAVLLRSLLKGKIPRLHLLEGCLMCLIPSGCTECVF